VRTSLPAQKKEKEERRDTKKKPGFWRIRALLGMLRRPSLTSAPRLVARIVPQRKKKEKKKKRKARMTMR